MNLPELPEAITEQQLNQALATLDIPAEHLKRITIAAGCAEVEYFRLNDHGGVLGHQRAVATVVTNIRIESE